MAAVEARIMNPRGQGKRGGKSGSAKNSRKGRKAARAPAAMTPKNAPRTRAAAAPAAPSAAAVKQAAAPAIAAAKEATKVAKEATAAANKATEVAEKTTAAAAAKGNNMAGKGRTAKQRANDKRLGAQAKARAAAPAAKPTKAGKAKPAKVVPYKDRIVSVRAYTRKNPGVPDAVLTGLTIAGSAAAIVGASLLVEKLKLDKNKTTMALGALALVGGVGISMISPTAGMAVGTPLAVAAATVALGRTPTGADAANSDQFHGVLDMTARPALGPAGGVARDPYPIAGLIQGQDSGFNREAAISGLISGVRPA